MYHSTSSKGLKTKVVDTSFLGFLGTVFSVAPYVSYWGLALNIFPVATSLISPGSGMSCPPIQLPVGAGKGAVLVTLLAEEYI